MSTDLPALPELIAVPDPDPAAYGWGMPHLIPWRMQEAQLAEWHAEAANRQACNAMSREATLVAASRDRVRRITRVTRVVDDDPPTAPIAGLPVPPAAPRPPAEAPAWDPKDPKHGTAKERGRRWYVEQLDAGFAKTVGQVNVAIASNGGVSGADLTTWKQEAGR